MISTKTMAIFRGVTVMSFTVLSIAGATFAAKTLNTSATLANNNASITKASIAVSTTGEPDEFDKVVTGFSFSDLEPGGPEVSKTWYVKNTGKKDMSVASRVVGGSIPEGINPAKVHIELSGVEVPAAFFFAPEADRKPLPAWTVKAGATVSGTISIQVDEDAWLTDGEHDGGESTGNFNIVFAGTPVKN